MDATFPGRGSCRHFLIQTVLAVLALLGAGRLCADPPRPPADLYDSGDYYLLRDRSLVPLLRSASEIAVKRAKTLGQETAVSVAGARNVVTSTDACGAQTTHQIEIYSVTDTAKARANLAALAGNGDGAVVWISPVLVVPESGKRVLLSDELIVQFEHESATNGVSEGVLKDLAGRGFELAAWPLPSAPGQYLLRS